MVKYSEIIESSDVEAIRSLLNASYRIDGEILITSDGISIDGDCSLRTGMQLPQLPLIFKQVGGDFICSSNQLTSLQGAPQEITESFFCDNNQLTSLHGCPNEVGGYFYCYNNQLTSLQGCPQEVGGGFICSYNQLVSLEGCPKKIGGGFSCSNNQLISLQGGPKEMDGRFYCSNNDLTSLDGLPKSINVILSWHKDLPLLRLVGSNIFIHNNEAVRSIFNNYIGNPSRSSILSCQKELIQAGFEGNASW